MKHVVSRIRLLDLNSKPCTLWSIATFIERRHMDSSVAVTRPGLQLNDQMPYLTQPSTYSLTRWSRGFCFFARNFGDEATVGNFLRIRNWRENESTQRQSLPCSFRCLRWLKDRTIGELLLSVISPFARIDHGVRNNCLTNNLDASFGTGRSSMLHREEVPFAQLKITLIVCPKGSSQIFSINY